MAKENLNIYMATAGSGDPLILLHGFTGSTETWTPHVPILSQKFRVITLDLPGHGKTESPAEIEHYDIKRSHDILWSILEYLKITRTNLLGYSMGGRVALSFAIEHPDRINRLVLESTSPGLSDPDERQARIADDHALAARIENEGMEAFVNHWENIPLFDSQSEEIKAQQRPHRLKNNPQGLANSLRGMGTGAQPSYWERLSELQAPTLLIAGQLDAKYSALARQMANVLPNRALAIVENAGHAVHLEQPQTFDKLVLDFLESKGEENAD